MKGYVRENTQEITVGHSALRKCRNAVSAGVLSPISSAVGRNGAVGDKRNARAGARNYPRRRQRKRSRRGAKLSPAETNTTLAPLRGDASSAPFGGTCLPAGRSVRGSDTPPACHSTPRPIKGEGLSLCGLGTRLPATSSVGRLELVRPGNPSPCDLIRGKADACGREGGRR